MPRLVPALLLTAAAVVGSAGSASAHVGLLAASPGPGSTAGSAREVRLEFDEEVRAALSTVVVTTPDGSRLDGGELRGPTSTSLSRPLPTGLVAGEWSVAYRALAADGHPVVGSFVFTVVPGAPAATTGRAFLPGGSLTPSRRGPGVAGAAALAGGAAATGLVTLAVLRRRRPARLP